MSQVYRSRCDHCDTRVVGTMRMDCNITVDGKIIRSFVLCGQCIQFYGEHVRA